MFKIGDYVIHQATCECGKVVGYGHQIIDNVYLPTLVVRVVGIKHLNKKGLIEDLSCAWISTEGKPNSKVS